MTCLKPNPKLLLLAYVLFTGIARIICRMTGNRVPVIAIYLIISCFCSREVWPTFQTEVIQANSGAVSLLSNMAICLFLFLVGADTALTKKEVYDNLGTTTKVQLMNFVSIVPVAAIMYSRGFLTNLWQQWASVILILSFTATPVLILYLRKFKVIHWLSQECMMFTTFSDFYCWIGLLVVESSVDSDRAIEALIGLAIALALGIVLWLTTLELPFLKWAGFPIMTTPGGSRAKQTLLIQIAFVVFAISDQYNLSIGFLALLVGIFMPKTVLVSGTLRSTITTMEVLLIPFVFVNASKFLTFQGVNAGTLIANCLLSIVSKTVPPTFFYYKRTGKIGMWVVGTLLSCRGFIAMVAAQISRDQGFLSDGAFTEVLLIALITTLETPVVILALKPYCPELFSGTAKPEAKPADPVAEASSADSGPEASSADLGFNADREESPKPSPEEEAAPSEPLSGTVTVTVVDADKANPLLASKSRDGRGSKQDEAFMKAKASNWLSPSVDGLPQFDPPTPPVAGARWNNEKEPPQTSNEVADKI